MNTVSDNVICQAGLILDSMTLPECSVEEDLWKASYKLKIPSMAFLLPNVDTCVIEGCEEKLYVIKKEVTDISLFTVDGSVPGLKCILSCKECDAR